MLTITTIRRHLFRTSSAPSPVLLPFFSLHGLIQLFGELQQSVGILLVIHLTLLFLAMVYR
jgi:hypothetical protein